jgi:hypothetical protein
MPRRFKNLAPFVCACEMAVKVRRELVLAFTGLKCKLHAAVFGVLEDELDQCRVLEYALLDSCTHATSTANTSNQ